MLHISLCIPLVELVNHELYDTIYVIKNNIQSSTDLCLELNGLQDSNTIHDFEHLVEEAHMHADSSDITQIIQYHDGEVTRFSSIINTFIL